MPQPRIRASDSATLRDHGRLRAADSSSPRDEGRLRAPDSSSPRDEGRLLFYDWPWSPFCMKVRAILDYKQVSYERVSVRGRIGEIRRRGGVGKVPAIEMDGRFIADSTDIAYALEERFPEPSILPSNLRERGLCHALEDWADESLYFIGLYYRWYDREGRKPIPHVFGKSLPSRIVYRLYLRRILGQLRGQGTLRKPPEHVRRDLERHLDAIERMLSRRNFLIGDHPYLCDFALWGQLNYLARTPVGGEAMRGREAIEAFVSRLAGPRETK